MLCLVVIVLLLRERSGRRHSVCTGLWPTLRRPLWVFGADFFIGYCDVLRQLPAHTGFTMCKCHRVPHPGGTPTQMWTSLKKLRALPDETVAYCAHECWPEMCPSPSLCSALHQWSLRYTESNLRFVESFRGISEARGEPSASWRVTGPWPGRIEEPGRRHSWSSP